jgi:hypothetical protein
MAAIVTTRVRLPRKKKDIHENSKLSARIPSFEVAPA